MENELKLYKLICKAKKVYKFRDTRKRDYVVVRNAVMMFLFDNTKYNLSKIGFILNKIDHSTVLYNKNAHIDLMCVDNEYKEQFRENYRLCKKLSKEIYKQGNKSKLLNECRIEILCSQLEQRISALKAYGIESEIFNKRLLKLKQL